MTKICKTSRVLRILCQIIFYAIPIFTAIYWIYFKNFPNAGITPDLAVVDTPIVTNIPTRYMAFMVSLFPAGVLMYGLHHTIYLFKNFEKGEFISKVNAARLRRIGYTLFSLMFVGIFYDLILSLVMTFHNPPGHHEIAMTLGMNDLVTFVTSGVILLLAAIMLEFSKHNKKSSI